jgi:hypothetical protein
MGNRVAGLVGTVVLCASLMGCHPALESGTAPDGPISTPTPTPLPTPTPGPTPTPAAQGCGLPPGGGSGFHCPYVGSAFSADVTEAIAQAQREHPELFDFTQGFGFLSWKVLDRQKYHDLVQYNLERMGYCAAHDLVEIGVKNENRFNEQFQIMTSQGYARWGEGSYRSTCYPAWF